MPESKLFKPLIAALLLTALPLRIGHDANGKVILTYAPAMAKSGSGSDGDGGNDGGEDGGDDGGEDGGDDGGEDGGDDGGEDGGDDGGEDGGDDGGEDGGDDDGEDGGDDDGEDGGDDDDDDGDDDDGEDNADNQSGKNKRAVPVPSPSLAISRIEVSNTGIEIRYADGTREEIEHGVYELKGRNGKTLLERRATGPDILRLRALAERVSIRSVTRGKPSKTGVARAEVNRNDIEIRYANGWLEIIKRGRYLLQDPYNRTVVQRPATAKDRRRLSKLAKQN